MRRGGFGGRRVRDPWERPPGPRRWASQAPAGRYAGEASAVLPRGLKRALAGIAVLALAIALWPSAPATLPARVLGVYRTDAPAYENRWFKLEPRRLLFQVSDTGELLVGHQITKVSVTPFDDSTRYRVEYLDIGQRQGNPSFEFIFVDGRPPLIIVAHQGPVTWVRATAPVTSP